MWMWYPLTSLLSMTDCLGEMPGCALPLLCQWKKDSVLGASLGRKSQEAEAETPLSALPPFKPA